MIQMNNLPSANQFYLADRIGLDTQASIRQPALAICTGAGMQDRQRITAVYAQFLSGAS